jgi:hypothetical protein
MQGIAITGTVHPPKPLSVVHICQLCAYRMRNMTIRYQFDGVQDYFEYIFFLEFAQSKFQCKKLPWMAWYITESPYQNPRYAITMHIGDIIWQSASNSMPYNMNYNKFSVDIHWPCRNDDAMNSLYRYHPPPKVIISSQCMPALFI